MILYRKMTKAELPRLAEIDRTETIRVGFEVQDGKLIRKNVVWDVPDFFAEGEGEHTLAGRINFCERHLSENGTMIGAFDHEKLVGVGLLNPEIRPGMSQLAYLHVSLPYRRRGIASALVRKLLQLAKDLCANRIYVSATPSESAVGFYESIGFKLIKQPLPALYEMEPEDIHMVLDLVPE